MIIAGVDEVGRGCLAGPVTAAAVILKNSISELKDSKQISSSKRESLSKIIKEQSIYSFASISNHKIDEINIHQATLLAMQEAIISLPITPDLVYVDGKFTLGAAASMSLVGVVLYELVAVGGYVLYTGPHTTAFAW